MDVSEWCREEGREALTSPLGWSVLGTILIEADRELFSDLSMEKAFLTEITVSF